MLAQLRQRWFLIALVTVLIVGMAWPAWIKPLSKWLPADAIVAAVTFIMALPLETAILWRSMRRPGPAWLGSLLNAGLAPPIGWLASRTLPAELALGVIVATTVPCTLAAAAVWTRRAGGNDAVAFLVTMITNLACFLVVPTWLWLLAGIDADVNYRAIVTGLILLVVLPIVAAQLLRQWRPLGSRATRHKARLGDFAQLGILAMVLVGAVGCGERLHDVSDPTLLSLPNVSMMIAAVLVAHLALLVAGLYSARALRFARADTIAVVFAGSQKTLMVGAYLAMAVGPLAILPMVAYHAIQLLVDTVVADHWRRRQELPANASES